MKADRVPWTGCRLVRALAVHAVAAGCPVTVLDARRHPWSSATFEGERHRICVVLPETDAARAWLAALPEAEFRLPGLLVADVAVRGSGATYEIEMLVLEEA